MNLLGQISLHKFSALVKNQVISPGSFLRNLAMLGSGTLLAQAIPVLASPILTRIYSPADFAMLAVFMAMVNSFTPVICGKYEVAMVTPKSRVHAEHLLGIAIYCTIGLSLFLIIVFAFLGEHALVLLKAQQLGNWVFMVPLALLFTGLFTAANYWANRNKDYRLMSKAKVSRSVLTAIISILAGLLGAGFAGLLAGFLMGLGAGTIFIVYQNRSVLSRRVLKWAKAKRMLLSRYRDYPIFNATGSFINGITLSLPIFFLSSHFSDSLVGNYALVTRVTLAPVAFISASVSQINLKKIVDLIHVGITPLTYLMKITTILFSSIVLPASIIMLWGKDIFTLLFGAQWGDAGKYAGILMPGFAMQFIASTLSSTLNATQNNKTLAIWQLLSFVTTFMVLWIFAKQKDIILLLTALSFNMFFLYLLYLIFIFIAAYRVVR